MNQKEIIPYKRDNIKFAKKLRREATYSEKFFWNAVRNSQIGYTFIRQKSIGYYIFDFYCKELKLAIELDGLTHQIEEVQQNDLNKEEYLKGLGLSLLRFKDEEVVSNLSGVLEVVLQFAKSCDPTLNPARRAGL
ncbi:MAG: endonuclease domain-containing protein [Candidatus Kapaibacteriota bacterium]|jgi:very-short-patch-repair endonuclease